MSWSSIFGGSTGMWGSIFSGVASYAGAKSKGKTDAKTSAADAAAAIALAQTQGFESRKTSGFEKELEYYYKQLDNKNKRTALDSYGVFSKLGQFAPPGYQLPAAPVVPTKPTPGA